MVQMALLGLLFWFCGGRTLFNFGLPQRGAVKPLNVPLQLDVGGEGGGGLQKPAIVEEAEDSAALLGKGIQDEAVLYSREKKARNQRWWRLSSEEVFQRQVSHHCRITGTC